MHSMLTTLTTKAYMMIYPAITIDNGGSWKIWKSLKDIAGELSFGALIASVVALIISGVMMGFGALSDNPNMKAKGKTGALWSLVAAMVIGSAAGLITFANGIDIA